MNIDHLKYFYDAARLKSVSKAAELNYVGQPAISKAIRSLEQSLNTTLILHERNRFKITDEGAKVFGHSQGVFQSVEKLKDSLSAKASMQGEVNFSCQSSMAESLFLSSTLKKIISLYPDLKPNLTLGRTDIVRRWLEDGAIDFGIVINNRDFKKFNAIIIGEGNFNLVKSSKYKDNWKNDGVLLTEDTKETLQLKQRFSELHECKLKSKMTIGSWGVIKNFALQGIGAGFVPDYLIQNEIKTGKLKYIEKSHYSIPYEIIIVTNKGRYQSAKVDAVIDHFQAAQILK